MEDVEFLSDPELSTYKQNRGEVFLHLNHPLVPLPQGKSFLSHSVIIAGHGQCKPQASATARGHQPPLAISKLSNSFLAAGEALLVEMDAHGTVYSRIATAVKSFPCPGLVVFRTSSWVLLHEASDSSISCR